jgi:hypothetical protein
MKYHILTPFTRKENISLILKNFKRPNVVFHPIIDQPIEFPKEDWIKPFTFKRDPGIKRITFHAWNKFLDSGNLIDDDYYLFISDDDFLEPDFFNKIKDIDTDVILVSMKRGDNVTKSGYGTNTLIPHWHILMRSRIGTEQLIVKGKIIKHERFRDDITADGQLIGKLYGKYPHKDFTFKEDVFVWFNYLEPGRWNSFKK